MLTNKYTGFIYTCMKEQPLLSVIIPAFNASECIRRCMNSIIVQDVFPQSQVIVIDDGSTDKTSSIVHGYTLRFSNIELVSQSNHGVSNARNRGLDIARGKYVSFVDADDMVGAVYKNCQPYFCSNGMPHNLGNLIINWGQCPKGVPNNPLGDKKFFSRMIQSAIHNNAEIAMGGKITVNSDLYQMSMLRYLKDDVLGVSPDAKHVAIHHSNVRESANFAVYRKDFLDEHNLRFEEDMNLDEDVLFCMLATLYANRVANVADSLYYYCRHSGSLTDFANQMSDDDAKYKFHLTLMQEYGILLGQLDKYPQYEKTFNQTMQRFCELTQTCTHKKLPQVSMQKCQECTDKTCKNCDVRVKNLESVKQALEQVMPNINQKLR